MQNTEYKIGERVVRVFPRRTNATPTDPLAYVGSPDLFVEADRVEISVTFTWDLPDAEWLAAQWERVAPVTIGGPAMGQRGEEFKPGQYLKRGYVITSRGCPNTCWFCETWKRDGRGRELDVKAGWNVLDDNLLACSKGHIHRVFEMLAEQSQRACFTGGLEAARLADWHVDLLAGLRPRPAIFFAFDTPDDYEPLVIAAAKVFDAGFTVASHRVQCYVLIGYPADSFELATARLRQVRDLGVTPFAMLWRDETGATTHTWRQFQRRWARPAIIYASDSDQSG